MPVFARKEGQSCNSCHSSFPKLNENGIIYKQNGYRNVGEEGTNVWELKGGVPLALIAEVEAFLDRKKPTSGKIEHDGPDIKIDEVEIFAGGTLGKRASFSAEIAFDDSAKPDYGPVWAQLNDIVGDQGNLNLKVGVFDLELPFLSAARRIVRNSYIADSELGFFAGEFGVEANGQILGDLDANTPTYRYSAGLVRSDRKGSNKFSRGFGTFSATFDDRHKLGAIIVGGEDGDATDSSFEAFGALIAGETQVADLTFTLSYAVKSEDRMQNLFFHNVMGEILYMPVPDWILGTRIDFLTETKAKRSQDWGLRFSALIRYNIAANLWTGIEYRHANGGKGSPLTAYDSTDKGRLFVAMGF